MADYELSARLDDAQILAALSKIDESINKIGSNGNTAFEKVSAGSKSSAAGMGILTGATTAVVSKMIEMGQAAAKAFAEIIKGGVESAKILETSTTSIQGILGGDPKAALAAMDRIRQESIRLGVDLTELAPAFLPKVSDLDQFTKIGEIVASLGTLDPAQGELGARIALNEALVGDLLSLRRRFEIDVEPIRAAQAEFGELEGLLIGLEQVLKARGQDFETLSGTSTVAINQAKQFAADLQTTFGEPILEVLKEDFQGLNQFLNDNKDSLDLLASGLGDFIGQIAGFSGDQLLQFLQSIDPQKVQGFIQELQSLTNFLLLIVEYAGPASQSINFLGGNSDETVAKILDLNAALEAAIRLFGILNGVAASAKVLSAENIGLRVGAGESIQDILASAQRAYEAEILQANELLNRQTEFVAENAQAWQDRADTQAAGNDADLATANSILAAKQALEAETKAAEEAAAAQDKYNEAREEYELDKERGAQDLALKQQRALLDAEIGFAQKREDIARKNADAIEDIYRKNQLKIRDAAIDLRRSEEDIARKGARSQIEIERQAANRRVEIETNFRRELERIRARFDFDAQEAIRNNDAIAFLRIQRQKDFELSQAQTKRQEEVQDAETAAIEQRQKLQEQLQLQIEDAKIANQRKLEDLRTSLQRELQEQQIKLAREIEAAKIAEDRKRQEMTRNFQRAQEDFQRQWDRKLQDLIRNYQREIQIIQQYEAQKARIQAESAARARMAAAAAGADRVLLQNYGGGTRPINPRVQQAANSADSVLLQNYAGRQFGGRTSKDVPYLVGERGPELFQPDQSGTIYPNYRLKFNPSTSAVTNINNTRQTNFNVDALMSTLSPQQIAIVQQLVNQLGMSMYQ